MHFGFADDLRHVNVVLEVTETASFCEGSLSFNSIGSPGVLVGLVTDLSGLPLNGPIKHFVSDPLTLLQLLVLQVGVVGWSRMNILNHFCRLSVHVSLVVVLVGNFVSWVFKLANVDASSACKLVEVLAEFLQVVGQIMALLKLLIKGCDLVLTGLFPAGPLFLLQHLRLNEVGIPLFELSDLPVPLNLLSNRLSKKVKSLTALCLCVE